VATYILLNNTKHVGELTLHSFNYLEAHYFNIISLQKDNRLPKRKSLDYQNELVFSSKDRSVCFSIEIQLTTSTCSNLSHWNTMYTHRQ
jgi:hypothetical protein